MLKNAFFLFLFAIVVLVLYLPSYTQLQDFRQRNHDYAIQIEQLKEKNAQLKAEKKLLDEDPSYLEKVAREKMGLIKQGEEVIKIVPVNAMKTGGKN